MVSAFVFHVVPQLVTVLWTDLCWWHRRNGENPLSYRRLLSCHVPVPSVWQVSAPARIGSCGTATQTEVQVGAISTLSSRPYLYIKSSEGEAQPKFLVPQVFEPIYLLVTDTNRTTTRRTHTVQGFLIGDILQELEFFCYNGGRLETVLIVHIWTHTPHFIIDLLLIKDGLWLESASA